MHLLLLLTLISAQAFAINNENKRYDEITFLTTHNSYNYALNSNRNHGPKFYLFPNQNYPITTQLEVGVRAFMLDLHYYRGINKKFRNQVILCHGGKVCDLLGFERVINVLNEISTFLKENPKEIITIILESYVSVKDFGKLLEQSHLTDFLYQQRPDKKWPKISQMIEANKRLVIFNDRYSHDDPSWNHDLFGKFAVETKYSYRSVKSFDCQLNRGKKQHSLFILNHFITRLSGAPLAARRANKKNIILSRIQDCYQQHGLLPNFLTVDFTKYGNTLEVVNFINNNLRSEKNR